MTKRIFDTYHASDEEVLGVKEALDNAGIAWYETEKGRWWVGSAGLWVKQEADFSSARKVIDSFQIEWQKNVRNGYLPENGQSADTPGIRWRRVPVVLVVIAVLLYLMSFGFRL